ncbi:hypothetical protein ACIO6T_40900 [Streptomyces sp. NPDC087532]|uniref:hypothetical protein n=1 Tax=Streptomyces sp. NPDC087532 TaxID=3365795 RepID=UPI0038281749
MPEQTFLTAPAATDAPVIARWHNDSENEEVFELRLEAIPVTLLVVGRWVWCAKAWAGEVVG